MPLYPQLRFIRQLRTEEIDRQIVPAQHKGRIRTLHGNVAVHAVRECGAAEDRESFPHLPVDAKIGVQRTVQPLGQGH